MAIVDVLIPTYNRASSLRIALESLQKQTLTDFRAFIGDNCSSDDTQEIATSLCKKDPRFRYLRHNTNLGPVKNGQKLLELSDSPYVCSLFDDDWLESQFLEHSIADLEGHPTAAMVFSRIIKHKDGGQVFWPPPPGVNCSKLLKKGELFSMLLEEDIIPCPTVVTRQGIHRRYNLNEQGFRSGDYLLWLRIANEHDVYYLHECLYNYRVHPGQDSGDPLVMGRDNVAMLTYAAQLPEFHPNQQALIRARYRQARFACVNLMVAGRRKEAFLFTHEYGQSTRDRVMQLQFFSFMALLYSYLPLFAQRGLKRGRRILMGWKYNKK